MRMWGDMNEREILSGFAVLCRPHSRAYLDKGGI